MKNNEKKKRNFAEEECVEISTLRRVHSQQKVRFREYFEYFAMGWKYEKNLSFGRWWKYWIYILIIPRSY